MLGELCGLKNLSSIIFSIQNVLTISNLPNEGFTIKNIY